MSTGKAFISEVVLHSHLTAIFGFDGFKVVETHVGYSVAAEGVKLLGHQGRVLRLAIHSRTCPKTGRGVDIPPMKVHLLMKEKGDVDRAIKALNVHK